MERDASIPFTVITQTGTRTYWAEYEKWAVVGRSSRVRVYVASDRTGSQRPISRLPALEEPASYNAALPTEPRKYFAHVNLSAELMAEEFCLTNKSLIYLYLFK